MEPDGTASAEELLQHLETRLGPFDESRSFSESTLKAEHGAAFGVLAFGTGARTAFATFGVSRHLLGDSAVAQELVVAVADRDFAVNLLSTIGRNVLEHHRPCPAGERHRLPGWDDASAIEGVMAVPDPCVEPFTGASPPIEFVRLLPITATEATYAREHGWQTLAEALTADAVDLFDLFRDSVA